MRSQLARTSILLALLSGVGACGSTAQMTKAGELVIVVNKEPLHCKELGQYYGSGTKQKYALNNLKNIIARNGGNRVYVVHGYSIRGKGLNFVIGNDNRVQGYGFKCNK